MRYFGIGVNVETHSTDLCLIFVYVYFTSSYYLQTLMTKNNPAVLLISDTIIHTGEIDLP